MGDFKEAVEAREKALPKAKETKPEDDLRVLVPDPVKFVMGDREYIIKPLTLRQQKVFITISEMEEDPDRSKQIDNIVDVLSDLLKEPDKDFILDNADNNTVFTLQTKLVEAQTRSVMLMSDEVKKKQEKAGQ